MILHEGYQPALSRPLLSVVIPAYNEEKRLPRTLARVQEYLASRSYPSEILVVDDGSSDATGEVATSFGKTHPGVRLVSSEHRGKGFAVRRGMLEAQGHVVLFSDADLSTPIEELEKLMPWFERGYDIVIGSREGSGAQRIKEPFYRHFMGRVFNLLVRLLAVPGIQDTQCGFKAFRDDAARDVFGRVQLYGDEAPRIKNGMVTAFDVEVLFIGRKLHYRIKEIPVQWRYGTETKVNPFKDSWRNFHDVLTVRWNDLRGRYKGQPPLPVKGAKRQARKVKSK